MKIGLSFTLDQATNHFSTDLIAYQCLIGKLMYLACGIRLDIAFVVRQLNYHKSDPQISYICIAKQILQYLKRTSTLGILWGRYPVTHRDVGL